MSRLQLKTTEQIDIKIAAITQLSKRLKVVFKSIRWLQKIDMMCSRIFQVLEKISVQVFEVVRSTQ